MTAPGTLQRAGGPSGAERWTCDPSRLLPARQQPAPISLPWRGGVRAARGLVVGLAFAAWVYVVAVIVARGWAA